MESYEQNKFDWLDGFGEELDELVYEGMSCWLVSFRSLTAVYGGHFSYLIIHLSLITCGILTFLHAKANGSRFLQFWWGALIYGILLESEITGTRHWHAQAPIMFFGKRLPLHMVLFYPSMLYLGAMGVRNFNLGTFSEPEAVGIFVMIMEIPFRILSVKFLHITYHDTDPMYSSKFCGVPWIEIFLSMVSSASYVFSYYGIKQQFLSKEDIQWERSESKRKETILTIVSSFISPISLFLQKIIFYHVLHDSFNVNLPTCFFFLFTLYFSIVFCFAGKENGSDDEEVKNEEENKEFEGKSSLYYSLGIYIICLLFVGMFCKPQNEVSIGSHETTGDCTTLICSRSPLGKVFKRKKYLCIDDVKERKNFVYTFDCLPEGPPCLNVIWYTICGTAIRNRAQFIIIILSFTILISTIFLKNWLSDDEKKKIWNKLSEFEVLRRFFQATPPREQVVTFEDNQNEEENNDEE